MPKKSSKKKVKKNKPVYDYATYDAVQYSTLGDYCSTESIRSKEDRKKYRGK